MRGTPLKLSHVPSPADQDDPVHMGEQKQITNKHMSCGVFPYKMASSGDVCDTFLVTFVRLLAARRST